MTIRLRGSLAVLSATLLMLGCSDPNAAAQRDAQQKFQAALEQVATANRGFTDGLSGRAADLPAFRAETLTRAVGDLQAVINQGTAVQQMAAARVLGDTYSTLARHQVNLAQEQWASLWNTTSDLLAKVTMVSGAQVRAQSLEVNQTPGLEKLSEFQAGFAKQAQQAQVRIAALTGAIADLQSKHKATLAQRDEAMKQSQALNEQAFTLKGQARFDTYTKALAAQRTAQQRDAEAETLAAQLEVQQAELRIAQDTVKLAQANVGVIETQAKALAERQTQAAQQRESLIKDADNTASVKSSEAALAQVFTQVMQTYNERVQPAYDQADKQAAQAVAMFEKALGQARGDAARRRSLQADLLAAYATRLEVQGRWIAAQGNLARVLIVVDGRLAQAVTMGDDAQQMRSKVADFQKSLQQAVAQADELKAKSDELAGQLGTPGADTDVMSTFVTTQNQRIAQALSWIESSKM